IDLPTGDAAKKIDGMTAQQFLDIVNAQQREAAPEPTSEVGAQPLGAPFKAAPITPDPIGSLIGAQPAAAAADERPLAPVVPFPPQPMPVDSAPRPGEQLSAPLPFPQGVQQGRVASPAQPGFVAGAGA